MFTVSLLLCNNTLIVWYKKQSECGNRHHKFEWGCIEKCTLCKLILILRRSYIRVLLLITSILWY